jgi:hypothetical protein
MTRTGHDGNPASQHYVVLRCAILFVGSKGGIGQ